MHATSQDLEDHVEANDLLSDDSEVALINLISRYDDLLNQIEQLDVRIDAALGEHKADRKL